MRYVSTLQPLCFHRKLYWQDLLGRQIRLLRPRLQSAYGVSPGPSRIDVRRFRLIRCGPRYVQQSLQQLLAEAPMFQARSISDIDGIIRLY